MMTKRPLLGSLQLLQGLCRLAPVPQDEAVLERGVGQEVLVRLEIPWVPRDDSLEEALRLFRGTQVLEAHGLQQGDQALVVGVELVILWNVNRCYGSDNLLRFPLCLLLAKILKRAKNISSLQCSYAQSFTPCRPASRPLHLLNNVDLISITERETQ